MAQNGDTDIANSSSRYDRDVRPRNVAFIHVSAVMLKVPYVTERNVCKKIHELRIDTYLSEVVTLAKR